LAGGWCWFVLRKSTDCWCWFIFDEKYYWLMANKLNEHSAHTRRCVAREHTFIPKSISDIASIFCSWQSWRVNCSVYSGRTVEVQRPCSHKVPFSALFVWLVSHQPSILSLKTNQPPLTSNQPVVLFSHNKSALATNQTNRP
jgi:hypothetical protein